MAYAPFYAEAVVYYKQTRHENVLSFTPTPWAMEILKT